MSKNLLYFILFATFAQILKAEVAITGDTEIDNGNQASSPSVLQKKISSATQLAEIEKFYGKTIALLRSIQNQIDQKRQNLSKIRQEKKNLQTLLVEQNEELAGQIRAAYAMGQKEKLRLLLSQQDPSLVSRMLVYFDYLNKARLEKLTEVSASIKRLDELDEQHQQETETLEKVLESRKLEQVKAETIKKQRTELLMRSKTNPYANELELAHLKEGENKLKNLVASLQKSTSDFSYEFERAKKLHSPHASIEHTANPTKELAVTWQDMPDNKNSNVVVQDAGNNNEGSDFVSLKGKLSWPTKGRLVNKFGSSRSESPDNFWDGVLIDSSEGAEIHAVAEGKIAFSDWLRGYGLLTIVDHGHGYMTLYGFNQSLYRQTGDWVKKGEVIASVGQSGGRSQPGLYFGIRNQGKAIDPAQWCQK